MIAFNLSKYALHAVAIGAVFYLFGKSNRSKYYGQVIFGFGVLFLGMTIMKDTMSPLGQSQFFADMVQRFGRYPILGLLVGAVVTMIIQSSSASVAIL